MFNKNERVTWHIFITQTLITEPHLKQNQERGLLFIQALSLSIVFHLGRVSEAIETISVIHFSNGKGIAYIKLSINFFFFFLTDIFFIVLVIGH